LYLRNAPGMKRTRHNALKPVDHPSWLVVRDRYHELVSHIELAPGADPEQVLGEAMERLEREGWQHEEPPNNRFAGFFTNRDGVRWLVHIAHVDPMAVAPANEWRAWTAAPEQLGPLSQKPEQRDE
jgi:hypothetical protein